MSFLRKLFKIGNKKGNNKRDPNQVHVITIKSLSTSTSFDINDDPLFIPTKNRPRPSTTQGVVTPIKTELKDSSSSETSMNNNEQMVTITATSSTTMTTENKSINTVNNSNINEQSNNTSTSNTKAKKMSFKVTPAPTNMNSSSNYTTINKPSSDDLQQENSTGICIMDIEDIETETHIAVPKTPVKNHVSHKPRFPGALKDWRPPTTVRGFSADPYTMKEQQEMNKTNLNSNTINTTTLITPIHETISPPTAELPPPTYTESQKSLNQKKNVTVISEEYCLPGALGI